MGCAVSKLEEEEEVVSLCKERKRLLKSAVERRYALADAHCKYIHSLYAVAAALRLFVARHSSPSSPFLITFPPACPESPPPAEIENTISNPLFLHQTPTKPTQEAVTCQSPKSSVSSDSSEGERVDEEVLRERERERERERQEQEAIQMQQARGYFYSSMPPLMPSPQREFGWDFFNPFDGMRPGVIGGFSRNSDEDLRVVREEEGIPELEEVEVRGRGESKVMVEENHHVHHVEEEEDEEDDDDDDDDEEDEDVEEVEEERGEEVVKVEGCGNVSQGEHKGLIDTPVRGRELLEALKDVEDHFIRAYDSGKDVSKMLEVNRVHLQSGLEEIKENSTKLIQSITWHRSTSSQSSSCKSFLASSSKSSSTWTEFKNDLFDEHGGMDSGSHSSTLGRLYAWEKKLYEEVKAGNDTRKAYERKCSRLRNHDIRGDDRKSTDKTKSAVRDLYTRILVAIKTAESISKQIEKLRDEELHPQLIELLKGMMRNWKIMLESHETQNKIMVEVASFTCPSFGKFCNDSHRLATLQLEAELHNWRTRFSGYITALRAYVEALNGWLSKFVVPEVEFCSRGRSSVPPYRVNGPPLLVMCHDWLASLEKLPDKGVTYAMKSFGEDVRALWVQQGEEQHQKRKVESLAKELDRRVVAFQKTENRLLEPNKLSEQKSDMDMQQRFEYLGERKDLLDTFRRRLDTEKDNHQKHMEETQRIALNGFQTGFSSIFESLIDFSKTSLKMYDELMQYNEKARICDEKGGNPTYIEASGDLKFQ